jgi:excisionase family DNA binding protein
VDSDLFTSSEVGELLQMNPSSIKRWIDEGRLTAFRTPGGHRRIRAADLIAFLEAHDIPIPSRLQAAVRRRVLIVDDEVNHLKSMQRVLKKWRQLEVVTCENGIDALVLVGSFRPHLILLDLFMPEIDGLDVCRRLKANPETRDIRVIVVTGHKTAQLVRKALEAGAACTIEKPIAVPELLDVLGIHDDQIRTT